MQEFGTAAVLRRASALNWHDVLVRQGRYGSPLPHIIGADGAGVRTDTGEEVVILPSLNWGDREEAPGSRWEILGDHTPGTYAELVSVPAECVAPKPRGLNWAEAAALPLVGLTTYRALFVRGRLQRGESMLVVGAGGGIATMAIALAAAAGANISVTSFALAAASGASISVTSSAVETIERAVAAGARGGVLHSEQGWPEQARAMSPDH